MLRNRTIWQLSLCLLCSAFAFYSYLIKQNEITDLRIRIPKEEKVTDQIREEITRLTLKIDQFEDPQNLMRIASAGEYPHLSHPYLSDVITVEEGLAATGNSGKKVSDFSLSLPMGKQ